MSGFAIGFTLISLSQAALPKRATPPTARVLPGAMVSEIKSPKVNSPEFDQDFTALNYQEGKYAENWDQQQRIRSAVNPSANVRYRPVASQMTPPQNFARPATVPVTQPARRAVRPTQQAQKARKTVRSVKHAQKAHRKSAHPAQQAQKVRPKVQVDTQ